MFKHIYLNKDNGYPFLTGGELSQFNIRYYRWLSPRGVTNISDYVVAEGTIFVYMSGSIDGMIGSTYIADKVLDKCCLSNHVMRIIIRDKNLSYWTFAYLHSHGGLMTLKSLATGTAIPNIVPERVASMRIPKPDQNYNYIAELVSKYIELYSLSKQKENQAISMVEQEIEKWSN
jgi:type I restriction enzyme S subunit